MLLQILFYVFFGAFLVQFLYYLLVFFRLAEYKWAKPIHPPNHKVSVIIAAKNEANNLKKNLPYILQQKYDAYEVVVINDGSTDDTLQVLQQFAKQDSKLQIVNITETKGKKYAIAKGIEAAKNDILVFADADCKPKSPEWIAQMQSNLVGYTDLVLGYGPMHKTSGFLNKLQRFDTYFIGLQYLSYALIGKPYMGVGRNMAYRKSLFTNNNGFQSHSHIQSGDDDLFVNEVATKNNTLIEIRPTAHVLSAAKPTFKTWTIQKRRHMTTSSSYSVANKLLLGGFSISQILYWLLFVGLLVSNFKFMEVGGLFFSLLFLKLYVFNKSMRKLGESDLLFLTLIFEPIMLILNPFFLLSSHFTTKKWQ